SAPLEPYEDNPSLLEVMPDAIPIRRGRGSMQQLDPFQEQSGGPIIGRAAQTGLKGVARGVPLPPSIGGKTFRKSLTQLGMGLIDLPGKRHQFVDADWLRLSRDRDDVDLADLDGSLGKAVGFLADQDQCAVDLVDAFQP